MTILKTLQNSGIDFAAMSYPELVGYGMANHSTKSGYSAFKKAIYKLAGIDMDALKQAHNAEKQAQQEAGVTHELVLYSDAKAKKGRFAVTDEAGNGLWYGREFNEFEQSACECAAAEKAIYLAGLAREAANLERGALRLLLKVDAEWLTYWNNGNRNKAAVLAKAAAKAGIVLEVKWISGLSNPADRLTVSGGYCKSTDNLDAVVKLIEAL